LEPKIPVVKRLDSIHDLSAEHWNACVGRDNPFLLHQFFTVLEDSGTACPETGWQPCHLVLVEEGQAQGLCPLFLKVHSEGEFVFDYSWASAYQRLGGSYYPKLQCSVPYTPVPGPRYCVRPDHPDPGRIKRLLRVAQENLAHSLELSSLHVTFCEKSEFDAFERPWLARLGVQFHFPNRGYTSFDHFVQQLSARKRKAILKERREAGQLGLQLEIRQGSTLGPEHAEVLYRCYLDTCSRKWGRAALTPAFFQLLLERMPERVVLMLARRGSQYLAAALNLLGSQALYGRNWGCLEELPFLHFELCYYQAIDYAIEHGLERVEAGAQGFHKVARGYLPVLTYSQHLIRQPSFRELLSQVLEQEREQMLSEAKLIEMEHSPYKS
jgi:predicted N-acyltransferase